MKHKSENITTISEMTHWSLDTLYCFWCIYMAGKNHCWVWNGRHHQKKMLLSKRLNQQHKHEEYSIDACSEDQKNVLSYILQYFKKWSEIANSPKMQENFTPLRMTLCGVAGSGKSTLINTFVTAIRKITGKTNSVYICGPTGTAAFNAGGETCHYLFNIQGRHYNSELSA